MTFKDERNKTFDKHVAIVIEIIKYVKFENYKLMILYH